MAIKNQRQRRNSANRFNRVIKTGPFNKEGAPVIDYKCIDHLKEYISETGHIIPGRLKHTSTSDQRKLTKAIKYARFLALLPYTDRHKI